MAVQGRAGQPILWQSGPSTFSYASEDDPLPVTVISGGGGGGSEVQYTEGDTDASITGNAIMWEDASDTLRAVSSSKPLPIDVKNASLAITAAALPLPAGAATEATLASILSNTSSLDAKDFATETTLSTLNAKFVSGTDIGDVTINNGSGGAAVNIQDGGNTITVDGTVGVSGTVTVDSELTTADLDTGGGTDTRAVVGMVLAASGGGVLVGAANPMPISDNSSSLTIDNAALSVTGGGAEASALRVTIANDSTGVLSVDDNGSSLTIDNAALSVVGGGTEATALRVTIANNSTGVLSVDDNGASLTVDGTVAATQSGTWVLGANSGVDIGDVTINNSNLTVIGATAVGGTPSTAPVLIAGRDVFGQVQTPTLIAAGGLFVGGAIIADTSANTCTVNNAGLNIGGNIAHDAADGTSNPVKVGAKAFDFTPSSAGEKGQTAVAANDRANLVSNLRGELITGVKCQFTTLTNVSTTYNNTTTTATSASVDCWQYRKASISFDLTVANTPTTIQFFVEGSNDGTNFEVMRNGFLATWIYDDVVISTAGTLKVNLNFELCTQKIQLRVVATGTTASATFTVANAVLYQRT